MSLEQQIYSIESANINKETLDAMKNAGAAMKQIHAGLTIDKVDNVMSVLSGLTGTEESTPLITYPGMTFANNTPLGKRLVKRSRRVSPTTLSTTASWTQSWKNYNKRSSTSKCSIPAVSPFTTPPQAKNYPKLQMQASRPHSESRKTTRRKSYVSSRLKWLCERAGVWNPAKK